MLKADAELSAPTIGPGRLVGVDERQHRKTILPQIDGLRGVAICAVIFQHAFSHGISHALVAAGVVGFPYLLDNGWMGVSLFFILSGFVLSLPYTIGCFVGYLIHHATLGSLLLALTTMSMFSADDFFPHVNGPFWTLMLEIWFSILLPALMIAAARFGYWRVFAAAAVTALIIRLVGTQLSFPDPHINPVKDSIPARIDDFVVGVVVAKLYSDGHLRGGAAVAVRAWLGARGAVRRWLGFDRARNCAQVGRRPFEPRHFDGVCVRCDFLPRAA
jgi:peptidoglycan/LPS O-acetylase OafA/YrhL